MNQPWQSHLQVASAEIQKEWPEAKSITLYLVGCSFTVHVDDYREALRIAESHIARLEREVIFGKEERDRLWHAMEGVLRRYDFNRD